IPAAQRGTRRGSARLGRPPSGRPAHAAAVERGCPGGPAEAQADGVVVRGGVRAHVARRLCRGGGRRLRGPVELVDTVGGRGRHGNSFAVVGSERWWSPRWWLSTSCASPVRRRIAGRERLLAPLLHWISGQGEGHGMLHSTAFTDTSTVDAD